MSETVYVCNERPKLGVKTLALGRWLDMAAFLCVFSLSLLPLLWFHHHWILGADGSWYLSIGINMWSDNGYETLGRIPNALRGPVFPAILGFITQVLGGNLRYVVWLMHLFTVLNPLLLYAIVARVSNRPAAIIAAGLAAFFGVIATDSNAPTVDSLMLTFLLLYLLALFVGMRRQSLPLSVLSGALLSIAILTKENSLTTVPLAVAAALLLRGTFRGMIAHYIGLVAVCLPWWIWAWCTEHIVFLVQSQQARLVSADTFLLGYLGIAIALLLVVAIELGLSRFPARLLASERRRGAVAWVIVLVWAIGLLVLYLTQARLWLTHKYPDLFQYTLEYLLPGIHLWFLAVPALAYIAWRTWRGERHWAFYLAALILWTPVIVLAFVMQYALRQYIVPQIFVMGASGAIIWIALRTAVSDRHKLGMVVSAALIAVLAWTSAVRVPILAHGAKQRDRYFWNMNNQSVQNMSNWINGNVSADASILTTDYFANALSFKDRGEHQWASFTSMGAYRHSARYIKYCLRNNSKCTEMFTAVWIDTPKASNPCTISYFSLQDVNKVMDRIDSDYLLLTMWRRIGGPLFWEKPLVRSGTFTVLHRSRIGHDANLVLLKRTYNKPTVLAPVRMEPETLSALTSCARKKYGVEYEKAIRGMLPQGISVTGWGQKSEDAQGLVQQIYGLR